MLEALGRRLEAADHSAGPRNWTRHGRGPLRAGLDPAADGQPDAAVAHGRRAVELAPGDVDARVQLGSLLSRLGDDPAAAEQFRAAAELRPVLNFHLGAALARQGALAEAVDCFAGPSPPSRGSATPTRWPAAP